MVETLSWLVYQKQHFGRLFSRCWYAFAQQFLPATSWERKGKKNWTEKKLHAKWLVDVEFLGLLNLKNNVKNVWNKFKKNKRPFTVSVISLGPGFQRSNLHPSCSSTPVTANTWWLTPWSHRSRPSRIYSIHRRVRSKEVLNFKPRTHCLSIYRWIPIRFEIMLVILTVMKFLLGVMVTEILSHSPE